MLCYILYIVIFMSIYYVNYEFNQISPKGLKMAHSVEFQNVKGSIGEYKNEMEIHVNAPSFSLFKKKLTLRNSQIAWRVGFLRKKLNYWKSLVARFTDGEVLSQTPSIIEEYQHKIDKKYATALEKIPEIERELEELVPQVNEELFTEIDGKLAIPPGLWYMCESIQGNAHLNSDLKPFFLPCLKNRPYQIESLIELYKYKRAMIELATGMGKSKILQSIALASVNSGKRCMIVVPTEYLVGQMHEEMKTLHANTTAQGGGRQATLGWDILVTTIQSASGFADLPNVVCLDECHHTPAESWTKLAMSLSNATHVYGFTATAFRSDGLDVAIHAFAGPIVYSRDVRWGIQNGFLNNFVPFVIKVNPKKNGKKIILPEDKIQAISAYKILIPTLETMSIVRDRLLACIEKDRKVIVVFKTVQACKDFRKFCLNQITLDVASAELGKKTKAPLRRFQQGDSKVLLVNSGLISEGVDIPDCDAIIQVCQNSSDIMSLQILGRMLRIKEGKRISVMIDIRVNGYEPFVRSGDRRQNLYGKIVGTENVKIIEME